MRTKTIIALFFIGVGSFTIFGAYRLKIGSHLEPGPGFLPFLSSLLLIGLSFVLISLKEADNVHFYFDKPLKTFALIFLYGALLEMLGFLIVTTIVMTLLFLICGVRIWRSLLYSLLVSQCCYVVFRILLKVPLPTGSLPGV